MLAIFLFGVNFTVWGTAGLLRAIERRLGPHPPEPPGPWPERDFDVPSCQVSLSEVAVLMAAHDEEVVIADSLAAITALVPAENVYVVSDGSTDRTVEIAMRQGVHVAETPHNVGKAGALQEGVRRFVLAERYGAVLLLDADTRLDPGYFAAALPEFDDPDVVAVAGCAVTDWSSSRRGAAAFLLTAHRSRVYALLQRLLKFGQTWRHTNATYIVPGFASLYRGRVLPRIDINPPGLVIEDFNMTFEVYRRRLGKVGFSLGARALTQDPDVWRDYVRQTRRWALGFWQTVRRFRPGWNLFSVMLLCYITEMVLASVLLILLPVMVLVLSLPDLVPPLGTVPGLAEAYHGVHQYLSLSTIGLGVLLPDVVLTVAVAAVERRGRYLLAAPFLLPLRVLDAVIGLAAIPLAWRARSTGRWKSPSRRGADVVRAGAAAD
ncbi:glycosyltransferase family 2 protein [Amycolatopsis acidicola]|uniref:Glycosyltransferase family 2 protein n=1 Tax=Amycolatopsis acidicola TaxID=2596893 RepID=A0A5N0V3C3_9PSEU|nr:glycosyltransferase family 2 protein [Amycolatopsis acidicola]